VFNSSRLTHALWYTDYMAKGSSPAQSFLPVIDIDHGVVVRKDGTLLSILGVSATNLALKSPDEQQATMTAFQGFLNTLEFSSQIVIHSRSFDVHPYIETLKARLEVIPEELLRVQTAAYIEYIKTISDSQSIMQKNFYVVIPYIGGDTEGGAKGISGVVSQLTGSSVIETEKERAMRISQLEQRANVVIGGLSALGLSVVPLTTEQAVELFYELYNPGDSVSGATSLVTNAGVS
jgi:hypothetical protein